jgi:hypothetical protein
MKRALIGAGLALAPALSVAAVIPPIISINGIRATPQGVTVRVPPLGPGACTPQRTFLTMALDKGAGGVTLLIAARPAQCRARGTAADVSWTWQELGLKPGEPVRIANPLVAEGGADPASAASPQPTSPSVSARFRNAACQRFEVDAVAQPGKGQVRILGPEGPLDIEAPPLVAPGDVTGAEAGTERDKTVLRVAFTPEAARRLSAWSASHVGARMAILVDGRVLRLGQSTGPTGTTGLQIGGLDRGRALSIATGVSACAGLGSDR